MSKIYSANSLEEAIKELNNAELHKLEIIKAGATCKGWKNMINRINGLDKKINYYRDYIQKN